MPTEYPVEFKRKVIQRYEEGESIKNLSQELNIAQSTVYHWRNLGQRHYILQGKQLRDLFLYDPRLVLA